MRKSKVLIIIISIVIFFLVSCQTCRKTSIEDSELWASRGYQTRIIVYKVGIDGKLIGMFWDYHAQAQIFKDNKWVFVNGENLSDNSTYSIDGEEYYWQPSIYKAYLIQQDKFN